MCAFALDCVWQTLFCWGPRMLKIGSCSMIQCAVPVRPAWGTFYFGLRPGMETSSISEQLHTRGTSSAATRGLATFPRPLGKIFHATKDSILVGIITSGQNWFSQDADLGWKVKKKEWNFKPQRPQTREGTDLVSPIFPSVYPFLLIHRCIVSDCLSWTQPQGPALFAQLTWVLQATRRQ